MPTAKTVRLAGPLVGLERSHRGTDVARLALGVFELTRLAFALAEGPVVKGQGGEAACRQGTGVGAGGLFLDGGERPGRHDRGHGFRCRQVQHAGEPVAVAGEDERLRLGVGHGASHMKVKW